MTVAEDDAAAAAAAAESFMSGMTKQAPEKKRAWAGMALPGGVPGGAVEETKNREPGAHLLGTHLFDQDETTRT